MMKRFLVVSLVCSLMVQASHSNDTQALLKVFTGNDWPKVLEAKKKIENMEEAALTLLFPLLDNDRAVKLKNTGDLIYPGAERFYGHGMIIDYDIDQLIIRTGWLLERITFENFGFSTIHDREENLDNHIKVSFKEFLTPELIHKIERMSVHEKRQEMKKMAVRKAKEWYKNELDGWNRLNGIVNALNSDDNRRQIIALQYLRYDDTSCKGLNIETYLDQLKPRIVALSRYKITRVSEQAVNILNDADFEFIKIKAVK